MAWANFNFCFSELISAWASLNFSYSLSIESSRVLPSSNSFFCGASEMNSGILGVASLITSNFFFSGSSGSSKSSAGNGLPIYSISPSLFSNVILVPSKASSTNKSISSFIFSTFGFSSSISSAKSWLLISLSIWVWSRISGFSWISLSSFWLVSSFMSASISV